MCIILHVLMWNDWMNTLMKKIMLTLTENVLEIEFYPSWNILEYTGISFLYCCTNPVIYVTFDFDSITFPLQITFSLTPLLNFLFVPNKIDCVLPRWRDSLLSIIQLLTYIYSSSELKVVYTGTISATFFPEAIKAESSAYILQQFASYCRCHIIYI